MKVNTYVIERAKPEAIFMLSRQRGDCFAMLACMKTLLLSSNKMLFDIRSFLTFIACRSKPVYPDACIRPYQGMSNLPESVAINERAHKSHASAAHTLPATQGLFGSW